MSVNLKQNVGTAPEADKGTEISRRALLRGFAGAAVVGATGAMASLPFGKDVQAGEQRAIDMADEMDAYSQNPNIRGIGVFINLQENAPPEGGEQLGGILKNAFATRGVPLDYRVNRSQGTTTDITFYVRGYDFTINIDDLNGSLGEILAHHGDVWANQASTAVLTQ